MGRGHPQLLAALVVALLSLVGTPPTAVFFGKLTVFTVTREGAGGVRLPAVVTTTMTVLTSASASPPSGS